MGNRIYGYARVSSLDQNESRQVIALEEFGVRREDIYVEKMSGKDFNRPKFKRLVKKLREGDVLAVKSIDRLGRNYSEIIEQWRYITKVKGADIVVLDMAILDTRREKDLVGTLISDIVLQLLSYVAQTEREFIHQRQAEGIAAAKARGVRFGRPAIKRPPEYEIILKKWMNGEIAKREASRELGISRTTLERWVKNK